MQQYLDLLKEIIDTGVDHPDRTGTGRRSIFGKQLRFKMSDGFPLVTTRKISTKALIHELVWFISGDHKVDYLKEHNVKIWDKWTVTQEDIDKYFNETILPTIEKHYEFILDNEKDTDKETILKEKEEFIAGVKKQIEYKYLNSIGPIYGPKWRNIQVTNNAFEPYDEIADPLQNLITNLKERPFSSRHVINTWEVATLADEKRSPIDNVFNGKGALAPCHVMQQYFVKEIDGVKYLSLLMFQRSADVPIGVPYNIAQYSLLLNVIAKLTGMVPDEFVYTLGDAHIYFDQLEIAKEQVQLEPLPLPKLVLKDNFNIIDEFSFDSVEIVDYQYQDFPYKYPVAE